MCAVLVSPGVDVQIIDESFYGPAGPGTVPLIVIATEANKATPSGDGIAPFTVPSQAGRLFLATSQRELLQNFGNPVFRSAGGVPLHGDETNEYGLHAAYSFLGVSNRAYVIRAPIDVAALRASDTAPRGRPIGGTFWLDIADTRWGVFQSNGSSQPGSAWVPQPVRIAMGGDLTPNDVPLNSFGRDGDFAVVPVTAENYIYEKINGAWYRLNTAAWNVARPTLVVGTVANPPSLTDGDSIRIGTSQQNSVTVGFDLTSLSYLDAINAINAALADANMANILEAEENNDAVTIRNKMGTDIFLANNSGTPLATLGLPAGTRRGNRVVRTADAQYPSSSVAGDVWVKGTIPNRGAEWVVRVYNEVTNLWTAVSTPFYVFDSTLNDGASNKDLAARAALGNPIAGTLYVGYDPATGVQSLRRWSGQRWEQLVYEADFAEPSTDPEAGTLWYSSDFRADIMVGTGTQWIGYRRRYPLTDPAGVMISGSAPLTQSDGTPLVENDLWIDSSDLENYPAIRRYDATQRRWRLIDKTDQTTPFGMVFADARANTGVSFQGIQNSGDYAFNSTNPADMALSDFLDPDAPDPRAYPADMLLFNMRYSTYNVKAFRPNYFEREGYSANTDYTTQGYTVGGSAYAFPPTTAGRWVTASGNKADGSPNMGRKAQRTMIVRAMAETLASNEDLRSELVYFNLISAPGYPELIDEMVVLNTDQKEVSFIIADSPARLAPTGTAIQNWAANANGAASNGEDGLTSASPYVSVFYPWGLGQNVDGQEVMIPPATIALRVFALNDQLAYPWFAPAGFTRGLVTNATTVGYLTGEGEFRPVLLNSGQRDVLYLNRMNPIAFIPNRGLVVYGQKTLAPTSTALDRINVARLANYLKYNLDNLVKPFLFEQNDEPTRQSAKIATERFLNTLVGLRALDDYAVLCDETNNTPERIDRNELWIDILIRPLKSVEFIYVPVRIRNSGDELNFAPAV